MTFILQYWKYLLIAILAATTLFYKARYDSVSEQFTLYKAKQQVLYEQAVKENKEIKESSKKVVDDLLLVHKQELEKAQLDRVREANKLKGTLNEVSNSLTIAYDAIELRNNSTDNNTLPEVLQDSSRLAETLRACNRSLVTVTEACKVTTLDYGALYNAWDKQCLIHGCE